MACWLLGVGVVVETKWFYEMINLMTVITGNVQLTSAENEDRAVLDLFVKIQKFHCRTGSTSSSCGRLMGLIKKVSVLTGLSLHTVITALQSLRDICSLKILHGNLKLGSRGKIIKINESLFGHKRKYNRGQVGQGTWVFGMVKRGTGWCLAFRVPNRTRETLVTGLVQKFIEAGTTIISDKFSPYFNLNSIGYIHLTVNHSENFVDPYTGNHSNTIEGVWSQIKRKLKAMNGTVKSKLPSYLDEYNCQKC